MSTNDHPHQKRWTQAIGFDGPHLRIPYRFIQGDFGYSPFDEERIRAALQQITDGVEGCIEFYDDTVTKLYHDKYIQVRQKNKNGDNEGCGSALGMVTESWGTSNDEGGKYQEIGLGPGCLPWPGIIQHEFYHALGFAHEQNRNDQDDHIVIHYENIPEDGHVWFKPMGERWLDVGEKYQIDSIMHYGGIVDAANEIYSMTRVDNGEPVNPLPGQKPAFSRPSSGDIFQAYLMYQSFCPVPPSRLYCDNGEYFLEGRECDGVPDCTDGSDENVGFCGSMHCGDQIIIKSDLGQSFEGTYDLSDEYVNGKVAYEKKNSPCTLSYNATWCDGWCNGWNLKNGETVLAWGLNYDGECPLGADKTWHLEPKDPLPGFAMTSVDYKPKPTEPSNGRCEFSSDFVRHCNAQGDWYTVLYTLSPEECARRCSNDYPDCHVAHHHPAFQIWPDEKRTHCWLWSKNATKCDWGGAEGQSGHPGATMIRCNQPGELYILLYQMA